MNQFPKTINRHRLAIIGEGPTSEDNGVPFSASSGRLVGQMLSQLGIPINQIYLGFVSNKKTCGYTQSPHDAGVIQASAQLRDDLTRFQPNCCLLLGDLACKVFGFPHTAYTGRGTIFISPTFRHKCVATLDPWMVMRAYQNLIPFGYDFHKAKEQSLFPDYREPARQLEPWPTFARLTANLEGILRDKPTISFDLEGYPNQTGVTCYSICRTDLSQPRSFIVPFRNLDRTPYWTLEEETVIWDYTRKILGDPDIKKVAQNAMYELFVFAWRHKILVRGLEEDTMFKMWELFSELPKSLEFISSVFTQEPFYKDERVVPDLCIHHEYCCKDSYVTKVSSDQMDQFLVKTPPQVQNHYRFNIKLLKPYLYMQLRGCKIDVEKVAEMRQNVWGTIEHQQAIVNEMADGILNTKSTKQMQQYLYGTLNLPEQYKPGPNGKKTVTTDFGAICALYTQTELPVLLEIAKLTRARTRFSDLNKLQTFSDGRIRCNYNPVGTDTGRLSSSETWVEAIVEKQKMVFKRRVKNKIPYTVMEFATERKVENLGTNLQNVTKDLRVAFVPDRDDFDFYQYDLSGADAWTVAADLAALGNDKMLVHLQHGIKPSIVIVLLTQYANKVYEWDLPTLKVYHDDMLAKCKKEPKLVRTYVCAKGCQHGTNYGMQARLMATLQLKRSVEGYIDNWINGKPSEPDFSVFHQNTIDRFQQLYYNYYGLELRKDYLRRQLCNHGYLDAASGQRRYFLEIRNRRQIDDAILRVAASHEPQANTTWATNAALSKLYYDRENRTPRGNLRVEPTLMIHDALAGQWHQSNRDWAVQKFQNEWFDNELVIHGIPITIPVEGGFGRNWKDTD